MIPNDERGWILAFASGLACVLGASLINLDVALHVLPRWRGFEIQKSTTFLAASLSLSFGVMFFSALFGLLPEAREYFLRAKYRPDHAGYASVGFFLVGVLGLQLISELLHRCLPSSIVNCEEHAATSRPQTADPERDITPPIIHHTAHHYSHDDDEHTPLLDRPSPFTRRLTDVFTARPRCDANGKCYGYSDHPCDQVCALERGKSSCENAACSCMTLKNGGPPSTHRHSHSNNASLHDGHHNHVHVQENEADHADHEGHHHVAKNKYLSIGVQTSIAIALHKFPEGFITYATNHANPNLGFTVFLALFIHNIAEGFAMALPLFLAFNSRAKAVIWASVLGGLAQPIGAGIAMLSIRGREYQLNTGGYGVLFSITAGIMCSVGLQLFSQAIQIHHGNRLSFIWAFIGMGILGFSSALTAE